MTGRQWAWVTAIGAALLYALVTIKYAYDTSAFGPRTAGLVSAAMWAVPILAGLAGVIGVIGAIKDSFKAWVIRAVNAPAARIAVIALSLAIGTGCLIAALRAEPPRTWACEIQSRRVAVPDRARCPGDAFAALRSFRVVLVRTSDPGDPPTLRAQAVDRAIASIAIDSDRGGLCVATGPDQPTRGESRLALSPDCGADRRYPVNLHVCDAAAAPAASAAGSSVAAELRAAVRLEIQEGSHASAVDCN